MTTVLRSFRTVILAFFAPRAALLAENLVLRQQLIVFRRSVARPRLLRFDRWLIASLAGRFQSLGEVVIVVRPETLLGRWRSRSRRPPGRPPIDADRHALIRRMGRDNLTSSCAISRSKDSYS